MPVARVTKIRNSARQGEFVFHVASQPFHGVGEARASSGGCGATLSILTTGHCVPNPVQVICETFAYGHAHWYGSLRRRGGVGKIAAGLIAAPVSMSWNSTSTITGEEVVLFTLARSPDFRESKMR